MNGDNVVFLPSAEEEREYIDDDGGMVDTVATYPGQELAIARRTPQSVVNGLSGLGDDNLLSFGGIWAAIKRSYKPLILGALIGGGIMWYENRTGFFQNLLKG